MNNWQSILEEQKCGKIERYDLTQWKESKEGEGDKDHSKDCLVSNAV